MEASGPFSTEVVSALQSVYKRGMTGWGKKHSSSLEVALRSIGLNLGQVKVSGEGSASDNYNYYPESDMKKEYEERGRRDGERG